MPTPKKQFETVDEYIQTFPPNVQKILEELRQSMQKLLPEAVQTISYQIPTFKLGKTYLIYFAAFKHHIGVFPPPPKVFTEEVAPYAGPKGNLRFPLDLIKRIVEYRVEEVNGAE